MSRGVFLMAREFNVAVAGATGAVGTQMVQCLEERNFPVKDAPPFGFGAFFWQGGHLSGEGSSCPGVG